MKKYMFLYPGQNISNSYPFVKDSHDAAMELAVSHVKGTDATKVIVTTYDVGISGGVTIKVVGEVTLNTNPTTDVTKYYV